MKEIPINEVREIKVSYRTGKKTEEMKHVNRSKDVYEILTGIYSPDDIERIEEFVVLYFNYGAMMLGWAKICQGSISGCVVDPKNVFQIALKANASGIILAHNHPSGNLEPSESDKRLTKKLVEGGKLLDIVVLDHLIISKEGYYSFSDEGEIN